MATYIIGDIQGCYAGLCQLLDNVSFNPENDTLYSVGDLIARGEDSLNTLRLLRSFGESFKTVLGNHDLHFLAVSQGLKKAKRNDNLEPLLAAPELPDIVDWYRQWPLAMSIDSNHTIVHAGLYPAWSVKQLLQYSEEISQNLRSVRWRQLLENMYGNGPAKWQDKLKGKDRQRFIINATTRMRFVEKSLALNLNVKSAPADAPSSLLPWFSIKNKQLEPQHKIIFGHWAALLGNTTSPQFVALDTGYVWGNTMTALHLEAGTTISVKASIF